jgi:TonB family protein
MLERNRKTEIGRPKAGLTTTQPRRLQMALVLLLVALAIVLVKDRDFWFSSDEAFEPQSAGSENVSTRNSAAAPVKTAQAPAAPAASGKKHLAPKISSAPAVTATAPAVTATAPAVTAAAPQEAANPDTPVVATKRTVLPPLDIEVVAGDTHRTVRAGSDTSSVDISRNSNRFSAVTSASAAGLPANAAEITRLSSEGIPEVRQTIDSTLPLLGQHMSVQGSVVLQAIIGVDGNIENLRVLSGPTVLSVAAQQAVRQWHFKPYLQNGQPVETKSRITVNFSIRISNNPANAS